MEKSTTFIYGLVSTKDLTNVRYVGKTVQRLSNRLYEHLQCHKGKNTHKQSWIKQQQNLGYSIKIILIDEVWTEDWEFWEMFWIQEYFRRGYKLTNLAPGGNQPNNTEEIYVINSNNEIELTGWTQDTGVTPPATDPLGEVHIYDTYVQSQGGITETLYIEQGITVI